MSRERQQSAGSVRGHVPSLGDRAAGRVGATTAGAGAGRFGRLGRSFCRGLGSASVTEVGGRVSTGCCQFHMAKRLDCRTRNPAYQLVGGRVCGALKRHVVSVPNVDFPVAGSNGSERKGVRAL